MPIVLAAPYTSPGDEIGLGLPRRMTWTGVDGVVWQLTRPGAINPRMGRGVKGLHMPPMTVFSSSTPLVPGIDLTGYALPERPVYWPLIFRASSADEWMQDHGAFFDSFHPIDPGTWTVGEGEDARTLQLTGTFDGSYSFTNDPFVTGLALIGLELTAPRPLWRGKPIQQTFGSAEGEDFIPEGGGPPFHISDVATFSSATIDNPGNEPAYLTWTVHGPAAAEEVQLGVTGAVIEVPFEVPDGSTLVIDTDPAGQYATLDGVDVTRELGFQMFAPVPAGGDSPLTIAASTTASVIAELVPLYWRAF